VTSTGRTAAELRQITRIGVTAAVVGVVVPTLLYTFDRYVLDGSVALFDFEEGGLMTWASSCATFAVAAFALLLSVVDPAQRVRGAAIAAGAAFVSFDDAVYIHERIAYRLADELEVSASYVQLIWPVLYLPLLVVLALLLLEIARSTPEAQRLVVLGLGLLTAAVALEVVGHVIIRTLGEGADLALVEVVLEESAELAGWILVATGAAVRLVACLRETASTPRTTP
jgi:hypothetical protein